MREHRMMMRRRVIAVTVGLLAVASGTAVRAQATPLDGITADPVLLLKVGIQRDLKLSDDQIGKASAIANSTAPQCTPILPS
jgi:hypothetical protein